MRSEGHTKTHSRSAKRSPDGSELLALELQQIHSAERQLSGALPALVDAAESKDLQQCLKLRQQQGERILGELEAAFNELEEAPGRKKNTAAEGLINGAREHIAELEEGPALDAVLIADVQKTEHYCIAAWGTAKSLASTLEMRTTVRAMDRALEEGKELDGKLTKLAQDEITPSLMAQEVEEVEEEEGDAARPEAGGSGRSRKSRRRTRGGASH